jgi:hypothetical protein
MESLFYARFGDGVKNIPEDYSISHEIPAFFVRGYDAKKI